MLRFGLDDQAGPVRLIQHFVDYLPSEFESGVFKDNNKKFVLDIQRLLYSTIQRNFIYSLRISLETKLLTLVNYGSIQRTLQNDYDRRFE
jgi:hypothetical protein